MMKNTVVFGASALLLAFGSLACADEHVVQAVVTQWKPMVTFAKPGDTLRFTQMAGHDTETIEGMIPEGAKPWKAKLGEEGFTATVDKEGMYIYKCNPHMTTGMVGVVIVGDARPPANEAALEAALPNVKVGKNMVQRAIKKAKEAMASGQSQ
ncbi:MAG: copper-binding protein [Gammaproteobacteria bacterium]|jgi:pseudoazurin|nr:copper-binding protein [Gammaproteobacteria bacterium]